MSSQVTSMRKRIQEAMQSSQGKRHRLATDGKSFVTRGKAAVLHRDGFSVFEYMYEALKTVPPRTAATLAKAEKTVSSVAYASCIFCVNIGVCFVVRRCGMVRNYNAAWSLA